MSIAIKGTVHQRAVDMAAIFSNDAQFIGDVIEIMTSGEVVKRSRVTLMGDIERILTADAIDALPIVGSSEVRGSNLAFDRYEVTIDSKQVKGTYYNDFAASLPPGMYIERNLSALREYADTNGQTKRAEYDGAEGWPLIGGETEALIKVYEQRRSSLRTMVNGSFKTMQLLARIKRECPKVSCIIPRDAEGNYIKSTIPVSIWNNSNPRENASWSVSNLLQLGAEVKNDKGEGLGYDKLKLAIDKGGSFADIMAVLKRERSDKDGASNDTNAAKVNALHFDNAKQLATGFNAVSSFFHKEDGTLDSKATADLYALMNAKDEDELVVTIHRLNEVFDDLATKSEQKYAAIMSKRLGAETKAA